MKWSFCLVVILCFFARSNAQNDTAKIYNSAYLKKGLYKSYEEYANNSPSVTDDFTVVPLAQAKDDSTIKIYDYVLTDSTKVLHHIWGFCDGDAVYVQHAPGLQRSRFWKMEYRGKYSFFTFYDNSSPILLGPTILFAAANALVSTFDSHKAIQILYIIMPGGTLENATNLHFMKNFFKPQPAILQEYESLKNKFDKPKLKDLIRRFSMAAGN